MKYFLLPLAMLFVSCASAPSIPQDVQLTGKVLGSYVGTSSGMLKGHILYIEESESLQKVSAIGQGDPQKVLLVNGEEKSLDSLAGKSVSVAGKIRSEHIDAFHTDFVLSINTISAQ